MWVDVTFLGSLPLAYTYLVPPSLVEKAREGALVVAPLRRRRLAGVVTGIRADSRNLPRGKAFKPILAIPLDHPVFDATLLKFYEWCARYYRIPLGGILRTAFPLPRRFFKGETVKTTPQGERALRGKAAEDARARSLWKRLQGEGEPLPLVALEGMWEALLVWTAEGWLQWEYPNFSRGFTPRLRYVQPSGDLPEAVRLGPKERAVLAFVLEKGRVEERDLAREFPRSRRSLRRLIEKGALEVLTRPAFPKEPAVRSREPGPCPDLTHEQKVALSAVEREIASESPRPLLLHGVTGGGKTELYIRAIQATLERGQSSLILVPEIVLTPQLVSRIRARCGVPVVVWHSHLTEKERWEQWLQLYHTAPVIVIGARSAVFTPVKALGLIVIDEEHDPSFKQEEGILYNARDVAVVRAREQSCPLILGSATPSIESYHNVKREKFRYCVLTRRPTGQPLPKGEVIDLRKEGFAKWQETRGLMLSKPLREALLTAFHAGQQSLLFLNRRGYARFVTCGQCGETVMCPRCSVSLILHKPADVLRCHYCGFSRKLPERCEACGGPLLQMGGGTQRLEEEIRGVVPDARIARLDRDTMRKRSLYETLLTRLRRREIDVLIGTQMIVKGHDYPGVTLMGVLMADHSLKFPDFRASERTFQLLTQASGRCGRGDLPGRVLIQTFSPDHYSIRHAVHHDFIGFYEEEIRYREELGYPPFSRLAALRVSGPDPKAVERKALGLAAEGKRAAAYGNGGSVQVLGPAPALLARLKDRFRWQVILKGRDSASLHRVVEKILSAKAAKPEKGMKVQVEFDPIQLV